MNELIEAWNAWSIGKLDDLHLLWGLEIFWWGRIGKFLQTIAIVTVIVEIIGPERLKLYGNSLHSLYNTRSMKGLIVDAFRYQRVWLKYMLTFGKTADQALEESSNFKTDNLNLLLILMVYVASAYHFWRDDQWFALLKALGVMGIFSFISGIVAFFLIICISTIGLIVDLLFIEPVAWIISHEKADKLIKSSTLAVAVIGLHFDFLAS